jgi:hypothetical protein
MKTRKKYSKEFKLDAVSLVLEQGYTRTEACVGYLLSLLSITHAAGGPSRDNPLQHALNAGRWNMAAGEVLR